MPFVSMSQRRKFYALKNQGKMDQSMIDKWEEHTPNKKLPERLHKKANKENSMHHFWNGFAKTAAEKAENYVSANAPGAMSNEAMPGAPEKMLKWNDHGGVDPRTPEELHAAAAVKLVTLSPDIPGASCRVCMFFRPLTPELGHGFCTNPDVKQDVTERMHCANCQPPGSHDPVAAAEEEAQEQEVEQAQMAQDHAAQQQSQVGGNPMGEPGVAPKGQAMAGGNVADKGTQGQAMAGGNVADQGAEAGEPSAESSDGMGAQKATTSPVGKVQGAGGPLVEQAMSDFQGQASSSGPMDGGGAQVGGAPASGSPNTKKPSAPTKKKPASSSKKSESSSKGHTININVDKGSEKKASTVKVASVDFWSGIVEGY